jgi:hypothetical protein
MLCSAFRCGEAERQLNGQDRKEHVMKYRIGSATAAAVAGFVVATTGCATGSAATSKAAATHSDSECVFTSALDDYQPLDNERLILWAPGHKQPYLLTLTFPSSDLKWGIQVGFEDRDRNGMICGWGMDSVVIPGGMPNRITIGSMTKITPDQAKAYAETAGGKKVPRPPAPETTR